MNGIKKMKNGNSNIIKYHDKKFQRKIHFVFLLLIIILPLYIYYPNIRSISHIKSFNSIFESPKVSICLCVIAKKENLYAREYVNYYKKLGYSHIYIYDNNNINDEKFEDVIQDEIDSGFVTIINIRGKIKGQCYAYKDCYEKQVFNHPVLKI